MRPDQARTTLWPMPVPFSKMTGNWPQAVQAPARGSYVTDGKRLFRVVTQFPPRHRSPVAMLEDCHTLEVTPFSPDELYEMELRLVRTDLAGP